MGFEEPDFAPRTLASLEKTFADGALAVKIYKSIGMELRSGDGRYVMPDDEAFAPILEGITARNRMLDKHPRLRVVGCHLGSMEDDVADIARRLERYPNFALDTAARIDDCASPARRCASS